MLFSPPSAKFARTTLKRALSLLDHPPQSLAASTRPPNAGSEQYPQWRYHFLIQLAQVACPTEGAVDYASAFQAWRAVEHLASQRGDAPLVAVAQLSLARLAVERNDPNSTELTEHLVSQVGTTLGFHPEDLISSKMEPPADRQAREERSRRRIDTGRQLLPGTLRVQAALLYCLWRAQEGREKMMDGSGVPSGEREGASAEAKARLKEVHRWLDEKAQRAEESEQEWKQRRQAEEAGYASVSELSNAASTSLVADGDCGTRRSRFALAPLSTTANSRPPVRD